MKFGSYIPGTAAWRHRRDVHLCRQTLDRIDEIVDGEVDAASLRRHLDACGRCRREADVLSDLKRAIARVGDDADPEIVRRLRDEARRLCEGGGC